MMVEEGNQIASVLLLHQQLSLERNKLLPNQKTSIFLAGEIYKLLVMWQINLCNLENFSIQQDWKLDMEKFEITLGQMFLMWKISN